jgi:uncharacterized protein YqiB (DUF1249 family)
VRNNKKRKLLLLRARAALLFYKCIYKLCGNTATPRKCREYTAALAARRAQCEHSYRALYRHNTRTSIKGTTQMNIRELTKALNISTATKPPKYTTAQNIMRDIKIFSLCNGIDYYKDPIKATRLYLDATEFKTDTLQSILQNNISIKRELVRLMIELEEIKGE